MTLPLGDAITELLGVGDGASVRGSLAAPLAERALLGELHKLVPRGARAALCAHRARAHTEHDDALRVADRSTTTRKTREEHPWQRRTSLDTARPRAKAVCRLAAGGSCCSRVLGSARRRYVTASRARSSLGQRRLTSLRRRSGRRGRACSRYGGSAQCRDAPTRAGTIEQLAAVKRDALRITDSPTTNGRVRDERPR